MILRVVVLGMMAAGIGGFAIFGWRALHQPPPLAAPAIVAVAVPPPPPIMLMVLVAGRDLTPGTFLRPDDLSSVSIARDATPAYAQIDTPSIRAEMMGALVRRSILHGSPIASAALLLAGDHGFLPSILLPGMRAYTIPPEQILSNPGLIWPGDRIDLILTQQMPSTVDLGHQISGETVLSDLRVLAIDRQLVPLPPAVDEKTGNANAPTSPAVTVEVSPENAQRLAVALRLGKVGFAVRADTAVASVTTVRDPALFPSTGITWAESVVHALSQKGPQASAIRVFGGGDDKEYKF